MSLLDDLVYSYELGEASGDFLDAHNSYTLTAVNSPGAAAGIGGAGSARTFNGSNQYGTRASGTGNTVGDQDVTFEIWAYFDAISGVFRFLFGKGDPSEYNLYFSNTGSQLNWWLRNSANTTSTAVNIPLASLSTNTWYQFICWHNSISNEYGFRANNGTKITSSWSGGVWSSTNPFRIGVNASGSGFFSGRLQYHRRWNRILSDAEHAQLNNGGAGLPYSLFAGGSPVSVSLGRGSILLRGAPTSQSVGSSVPVGRSRIVLSARSVSVSTGTSVSVPGSRVGSALRASPSAASTSSAIPPSRASSLLRSRGATVSTAGSTQIDAKPGTILARSRPSIVTAEQSVILSQSRASLLARARPSVVSLTDSANVLTSRSSIRMRSRPSRVQGGIPVDPGTLTAVAGQVFQPGAVRACVW